MTRHNEERKQVQTMNSNRLNNRVVVLYTSAAQQLGKTEKDANGKKASLAERHVMSVQLITEDRLRVVFLFACCYQRSVLSIIHLSAFVLSTPGQLDTWELNAF